MGEARLAQLRLHGEDRGPRIVRGWPGLGLAAALGVSVGLLGGCIGGAPANLIIRVFNESQHPVSVRWVSPGFLGTPILGGSGSDQLPPCGGGAEGFGTGRRQLVIRSASAAATFELDAPDPSVSTTRAYVIQPDGRIALLYVVSGTQAEPRPPTGCGGSG